MKFLEETISSWSKTPLNTTSYFCVMKFLQETSLSWSKKELSSQGHYHCDLTCVSQLFTCLMCNIQDMKESFFAHTRAFFSLFGNKV